ncbi:sialidase family protein [uncultured Winogradskyella sp.]|uniref:sialidase family protein n=1 Tax=uncultured Winogradskyella sp. TaxID=395353 RepID=UPI00262F680D|nr:sialidase family protein [uncultured Winogradskyella sp.]
MKQFSINYIITLYLLIFSLSSIASILEAQISDDISKVKLDVRNDAIIGKNIAIKSKFFGLPVVEPSISAHPNNNNHLLAAAMIVTDINRPYASCRLSSFVSKDGGNNWSETAHNYWGYDPWVAILPSGNAALSWLGTPNSFRHSFPLKIFTSNNGGDTWSNNIQSFNGFGHGHDGTKLVGYKTSFYLTTVRFNGDMSADVVLYESKNNNVFKEVALIKGEGLRLNFCEPAILNNGTVVIPTLHNSSKIWVNLYNPKTRQLSGKKKVSKNPKVGRGYPRMVADVGLNSRFINRIYFVRAVASGTSSRGIWINYSKDNGETWTEEKRIDHFETDWLSKANVASVAINKDGVIGVSWVDSQHDKNQKAYDVYLAISKDGGESFQKPIRVTNVSSNPRTKKNGDVANKFIGGGHYLGLTAKANGSFQLIWSDSRDEVFQLQTCNVTIK